MKTLIIGAAGFVGGHLIDYLNTIGWEVAATCLKNEKIEKSIPVFELDILLREEIETLLKAYKPDTIIHLAAQSSVSLSWKDPSRTIDVNIRGAVNLLEAVRRMDIGIRVLLVGSGEQYGAVKPEQLPICENTAFAPGNIYAATKCTQDMLGDIYTKAYGMDVIRVRAFNHIGPGQSPIFVVSDFCNQVARIEAGLSEPVIRVGNLSAKRDFTDVRDVVRAYTLLCEKGTKGEAYNVGSGVAKSIDEILGIILGYSTKQITVDIDSNKFRPIDVPSIVADISKLHEHIGWLPAFRIEDTVLHTLEYWRMN